MELSEATIEDIDAELSKRPGSFVLVYVEPGEVPDRQIALCYNDKIKRTMYLLRAGYRYLEQADEWE